MTKVRIDAGHLYTGDRRVIQDASAVIDGDQITFIGPTSELSNEADQVPAAIRVPALLPGFWDCHAHFHGLPSADLDALVVASSVTLAARATRDLRAVLDAGFTSVRELGGLGMLIAPAISDGSVAGPTVYGAGSVLSMTGGHGDRHDLPHEWMLSDRSAASQVMHMCDGIPDVIRGVRLQLRKGARVIKVCATGGILSSGGEPTDRQFSPAELEAIVAEAERANLVVAAHAHGKAGIIAALRAGVKTIEHGSFLDPETADLMAASQAIYVPTRFLMEEVLTREDLVPAYAFQKAQRIRDRHAEAIRTAIAAGVTIAVGTDISVSGPAYGRNSKEVAYLIALGMPPVDAIEALTANGPKTLGPQAPNSGRLAAGLDADMVALDADPIADPSVWGDASRVTHVWLRGRQVKARSFR